MKNFPQTRKLRICLLGGGVYPIPPPKGGSAESIIFSLASALLDLDQEVTVIDRKYHADSLPEYKFIRRIPIPNLRRDRKGGIFFAIVDEVFFGVVSFLLLLTMQKKFDIVQTHSVYVGLACVLLSKIRGSKFIYTCFNGMWMENRIDWPERIVRRLESGVVEFSDRTITVSRAMKKNLELKGGFPSHKIVVLSEGINTSEFQLGLDTSGVDKKFQLDDSRIVLYVGRMTWQKGVDILVRAIPRVLEHVKHQRVRFLFVGPTAESYREGTGQYYDYLQKLAESLNVKEAITFTGLLTVPELREMYSRADVLVIPSRIDAQPYVLLEAMASGLPIIGSSGSGIEETIKNGVTGYIFESGNSLELGRLIVEVLESANRRELSQNSRGLAVSMYDWKTVARGYFEIYCDALGMTRRDNLIRN
jgi:glycosyltransferase involved in cell wall biosynthesis